MPHIVEKGGLEKNAGVAIVRRLQKWAHETNPPARGDFTYYPTVLGFATKTRRALVRYYRTGTLGES